MNHAIGRIVYIAIKGEIICSHAQFFIFIDAFEDRLFNTFDNQGRIYRRIVNNARDALFLIGKEIVGITLTCHIVLAHQAVERGFNTALKSDLVHVHTIDHKDGNIFDI